MKLARLDPRTPGSPSALAEAVIEGFLRRPRVLPPWLLRDERGARLLDRLADSPSWYITRLERELLQRNADDIARDIPRSRPVHVVQFAPVSPPGTEILLHAMRHELAAVHYVPVDPCAAPLERLKTRLHSHLPSIAVEPWLCDPQTALPRIRRLQGARVILLLGGQIGCHGGFDSLAFLSNLRDCLEPGDTLLIGTDMRKDPDVMIRAHDDPEGIAAALHKNALSRINYELGGHFPLERFRHEAVWNPYASCIECRLESLVDQLVHIDSVGLSLAFHAGERVQTCVSLKYDRASLAAVLGAAGFRRELEFSDTLEWYTVSLARAA